MACSFNSHLFACRDLSIATPKRRNFGEEDDEKLAGVGNYLEKLALFFHSWNFLHLDATDMAKKEDLYTNNPTYSRPLPKNFSSKASDMAKALFGLRLTLEEKKGSTELVKFMNCQVHLQGDNVRHATAVCMGQANPEQFAQITVTVSFKLYH